MEHALHRLFSDCSVRRLELSFSHLEACLDKLTEEQVWARGTERENAVGNLVLHLSGNVRQWIVSGVGGAPDTRERDGEFSARGDVSIPELKERLRGIVTEAAAVIAAVTPERLAERVVIQKYEVSVLEAIYHVVEHFSLHTGQIIFATKMMTGSDMSFYAHLRANAAHGEKTP
jgi:uncharacterized damage-inducible protein DinB